MNPSIKRRRLQAILVCAGMYLLIAIASALISNPIESALLQAAARLAALGLSIATLAVHIRFEMIRLERSPRAAALTASIAVALGTFSLAVYANLLASRATSSTNHSMLLALLIWPVVTGILSFVAALVVAAMMNRFRARS